MVLSEAARSVWAKSINEAGAWLPLWRHLDDSAEVAGLLFDRWLAPMVVQRLAEEFGGDVGAARAAVRFLVGVHDLGKATPAFAVQDVVLAQQMRELGLYMPPTKVELVDRQVVHHAVAGHHALIDWLVGRGWLKRLARAWGVVVAGHHGAPPDSDVDTGPAHYHHLYGDGLWAAVRQELVDRVVSRSGAGEFLDQWREVRLSAQFQVLVTGLVIVADWIASNERFFPFLSGDLPEISGDGGRAARAWDGLGLPGPWRPARVPQDVGELFAARFRLPVNARPRPVQHAACEAARGMPGPGLLIVEAPMGEGKTEAALAAAEIMAQQWGCGGVFVALPTQATTDAMFHRVVDWLDAVGAESQQVAGAIVLTHGKARFNRVFQGMVRHDGLAEIGRDVQQDRSPHAVVAHSWLSGRKKSSLATFQVGTIDQLLFAGLKSRHLMLRHLGLAGKVVVLDEVHAYDAYMNSYLTRVLTWLGAYRVPVVALSATLPADRRRALVEAYQMGVAGSGARVAAEVGNEIGYPVLTWTEAESARTREVPPSGRSTEVSLEALGGTVEDDLDQLTTVLRDVLSEGGCALVVRNTVRRVLATAARLEEAFPGEVTVAHARFITADRLRIDEDMLDRFGPPGRAERRPGRHIVVASQVVEQSLDVDFDVLVTDLAPADLILQRLGRLHRHQRGEHQADRPTRLRRARAFLAGVDFATAPPELEAASARHVYGAYPLLRSAAVLHPRLGGVISLPGDIAPLVHQAYGPDEVGPADWQGAIVDARRRWQERTEERRETARQFQIVPPSRPGKAIIGWVSGSVGETDDDAREGRGQVRDGAPSLEVILVEEDAAGGWRIPAWLPGGDAARVIPREQPPPDDLAEVMASCSLRLPWEFSNEEAEVELWAATPEAWKHSPVIYRLPVLMVSEDGWGQITGRHVRYTKERGLEVVEP